MTEWYHHRWQSLSGVWFQEPQCTSSSRKVTSHISVSVTNATGRYSPPSSGFPRALSTLFQNPVKWHQRSLKKQWYPTMLQSRNKKYQAWPDHDRLQDQQYRYETLPLLNTQPHRQGLSSPSIRQFCLPENRWKELLSFAQVMCRQSLSLVGTGRLYWMRRLT